MAPMERFIASLQKTADESQKKYSPILGGNPVQNPGGNAPDRHPRPSNVRFRDNGHPVPHLNLHTDSDRSSTERNNQPDMMSTQNPRATQSGSNSTRRRIAPRFQPRVSDLPAGPHGQAGVPEGGGHQEAVHQQGNRTGNNNPGCAGNQTTFGPGDISDIVGSLRMVSENFATLAQNQSRTDDRTNDFNSPHDEDEFYRSFPAPWDVQPRRKGKNSDEQRKITTYMKEKFTGDEFQFIQWQHKAIANIHQANLSVAEKFTALDAACDTRNSLTLAAFFLAQAPTKENYFDAVSNIVKTYGGDERLMATMEKQLWRGGKLRHDDLDNCNQVLARLRQYVSHHIVNRLHLELGQSHVVRQIYDNLMESAAIDSYTGWRIEHSHEKPHPTTVIAWIEYRIKILSHRRLLHSGSQRRDRLQPLPQRREGNRAGHEGNKNQLAKAYVSQGYFQGESLDLAQEEPEPEPQVAALGDELPDERFEFIPEYGGAPEPYQPIDEVQATAMKAEGWIPPVCSICKDVLNVEQKHGYFDCPMMKKWTPRERSDWMRQKKRCGNCLNQKHTTAECKNTRRCSVEGCGKRHHSLLHY